MDAPATRTTTIQAMVDGFGQFKRTLRTNYQHLFADREISIAQLELLLAIEQLEPVSHKALAAKLQLTPGAVSQLLDGLDKQACITRTASSNDRRMSYITISPEGKRQLDEFHEIRKRLFTQAFESLEDHELQAFLTTQQKIITWLESNQPHNKPRRKHEVTTVITPI